MTDYTRKILQQLPNETVGTFTHKLSSWLHEVQQGDMTESRARALLLAADVVDTATLNDFGRLVENVTAVRVALHDLLVDSKLGSEEAVQALTAVIATTTPNNTPIEWLALAVSAFAWQTGYPLAELDPASPPKPYSPAGQLIKQSGYFLRQQIQKTPTERDKLAKRIAYDQQSATVPTLDSLASAPTATMPQFRNPIPVSYPEYNDEISVEETEAQDNILQIDVEPEPIPSHPPRANALTITEHDLPAEPRPPSQPALRISHDQIPPERNQTFNREVQRRHSRRGGMTTTKLRVRVQEFMDGPGLYGIQVQIKSKGIRSDVAGVTNRSGSFLCEVPVKVNGSLTYEIRVTWPRDLGGDRERKTVTLNAERTEFVVPFYRRLHQ